MWIYKGGGGSSKKRNDTAKEKGCLWLWFYTGYINCLRLLLHKSRSSSAGAGIIST